MLSKILFDLFNPPSRFATARREGAVNYSKPAPENWTKGLTWGLMPFIKFIFKQPNFRQFLKFSLVGLSNTMIDFAIYCLLTRGFGFWLDHYLWAHVISFSLAVTNSFIWNSKWTFAVGYDLKLRRYFRFFSVSIIALLATQLTLVYLVEYLQVFDLFAKVMAVIVSVVINFFANRYFVFKR